MSESKYLKTLAVTSTMLWIIGLGLILWKAGFFVALAFILLIVGNNFSSAYVKGQTEYLKKSQDEEQSEDK